MFIKVKMLFSFYSMGKSFFFWHSCLVILLFLKKKLQFFFSEKRKKCIRKYFIWPKNGRYIMSLATIISCEEDKHCVFSFPLSQWPFFLHHCTFGTFDQVKSTIKIYMIERCYGRYGIQSYLTIFGFRISAL